MTKFLLALHLLFAIFAIGPLVHAATTASRGIRRDDAAATASSARMLRIYAVASVLVVGVGFGLMSRPPIGSGKVGVDGVTITHGYASLGQSGPPKQHIGDFADTWIWLSVVLWVIAIVVVLALLIPTLKRATTAIAAGESAASFTARVAAGGGIVGLIFVAITVLMVYRPA